ncbi:uncharacterized protein [Nicotiana sylvestris]|uniref:uncharacterized protein n=1 Tax=Nicotiana sylvestris TaxID=4096 RepID=UPI00388C87BB
MEVYIDDMLIKTQHSGDHISHLSDTFQILRKFNMKLNPKKCAFGGASALKKQDQFEWSKESQQALKNLKTYLSNPPLLAKPKTGERLHIYLAVSEVAVSAVLVREDQDFVADFSQGIQLEAEKELQVFNGSNTGIWTLFTDGSSNVKGASLGIVLVPPKGETIRQTIKCHSITNKSDSPLVVNQMLGTYTARKARMQQYLEKVRDLVRQFQTWKVMQISRDENVEADSLANLASTADGTINENVSVIHLFHSVLDPDKNEYGTVPEDKKKAHALQKRCSILFKARQSLSKNVRWSLSKVPRAFTDGICNERNTRGALWKSRRRKITGAQITEFLQSWQIKRITSTPYHLVGNGQAQSTNKVIINNLKKRLEKSKSNWAELLAGVLWAYRTTIKTSTGETPFSLVYGAEALITVEIGEPSTRFTQVSGESNGEEMRMNLDLLEGKREASLIRMAVQKQVIERYYNRKARLRFFKIGDFVFKKVFQSTKAANAGKLSPTWGNTLQDSWYCRKRSIRAGNDRWQDTTFALECHSTKEILFLRNNHGQEKDQMRETIKCSRLHISTLKHLGDYIIYVFKEGKELEIIKGQA